MDKQEFAARVLAMEGRLGLFHMPDTADPIVPVSGAEETAATRLGETENGLARLTVEEALSFIFSPRTAG